MFRKLVAFECIEIAESAGKCNLSLDLVDGSTSVGEKLQQFLVRSSAFALGNVAGDRNRHSPELRSQAVLFILGKPAGRVVDSKYRFI